MTKKVKHTTVNLTPIAQEIKERLTYEWDLKKVLSAALLLFDRQDYLVQKHMVLEAGGANATSVEPPSTVLKICTPRESRTLDLMREVYGDDLEQVLKDDAAIFEGPDGPAALKAVKQAGESSTFARGFRSVQRIMYDHHLKEQLDVVDDKNTAAHASKTQKSKSRRRHTAPTQYRLLSPEEQKWLDDLRADAIAAQRPDTPADRIVADAHRKSAKKKAARKGTASHKSAKSSRSAG
jgi:hypothetical protein